ncbi:MAG: nicotinate-nucleotide diphosphorylase (carboxylating), partial [Myxococcales bacterium]|nr:nicotinate-nucleotide diphosphorylase (carboxylating) [Myxococcales bacterium]
NHIAAVGGVGPAIRAARDAVHHLVRIEVEVTDEAELAEALAEGADGVLLDNMDDARIAACVQQVRADAPHVFVEASGNMDAARLAALARVGLDVVSVGGFVHQARWADLSLRVTS